MSTTSYSVKLESEIFQNKSNTEEYTINLNTRVVLGVLNLTEEENCLTICHAVTKYYMHQ